MTTIEINNAIDSAAVNVPIPFLIPTDTRGVFELHVDNSSKEVFETCARAAQYYTVERREGLGSKAATFRGGVIHGALAIRKHIQLMKQSVGYADTRHEDMEGEQCAYVINAYADQDFGPDEWRTCEHAVNTILEYNKTWPIESEPFTIVPDTIEMPFKLLLGKAVINQEVQTHAGKFHVAEINIYWTGRVDTIVNYGELYVQEHKTTSILGTNFFDDFALSSQTLGYAWSCRKLGHNVAGVFVDALAGRKPTKSGKAYEFQRQRIPYDQLHIDEWEKDVFTIIQDFLEHLCRNYFPKSPKWCFGKYGRCQYWDVCTQTPDRREAMLQSDLYKPVQWSPLAPTK